MNEQQPQLDVQRIEQLRALSERISVPADELLRRAVDDLLARSDADITSLAEKITQKNAELYRRLA